MKRTNNWALLITLSLLAFALMAFRHGAFVDATLFALSGTSGAFFLMSPQRSKDYEWGSFRILSYIFLACAFAVAIFRYLFMTPGF